MKLKHYLKHRRNLFGKSGTARQLAAKLGITEQHLSRIANEKISPSWTLLQRIVNESNGYLKFSDFTTKK